MQQEALLGAGATHTIVDWCSFMRDICEENLIRHPQQLGGFDEDGQPLIVEIDESKFFHRKYRRGLWRPGHWVFGAVERISGKVALIEVPDRTRATLTPIIQEWILPGTIIMSDDWASYAAIDQIAGGIYVHETVIHEQHFVDPDNEMIHTQNIENT